MHHPRVIADLTVSRNRANRMADILTGNLKACFGEK